MSLYENTMYMDDVRSVANLALSWEKLKNKSVMISGATGLIGSFLVDVLLDKNVSDDLNCTIYVLGRSEDRARTRFAKRVEDPHFIFVKYDVTEPLFDNSIGKVDYVLHLASNTHPIQYATDPIGTITTNIIGLQNMLDFSVMHEAERFAFASSVEIYGENRGDVEVFDENYCGYIDCNTLRAGYPESKRCGEALCQAYISQKNMDIVIPRLPRTYGPTMLMNDSKALSQFIKKGLRGEDIILKSKGTQFFSYQYVSDSVSGLLHTLLCGKKGEAYNISDTRSDIQLIDLARMIADSSNTKVIIELPDAVEAAGYSKATKARMNGNKLRLLGWSPKYDIEGGITRTINILKAMGSAIL